MKVLFYLMTFFVLCGCEVFVLETKTLTLSGKYVVNKLDITNVDQQTSRDSIYTVGDLYYAKGLVPDPFDSILINRFYIHLDEASIRMNLLGVDFGGRDLWEYGSKPDYIFYSIFNNNTYNNGYIQFSYHTRNKEFRTLTFLIEHDGLEYLQLKSVGTWLRGKDGQKQVMTLYLTRVGP